MACLVIKFPLLVGTEITTIPWNVSFPSSVAILRSILSPNKMMKLSWMPVIEEYRQCHVSWPLLV